MNRIRLKIKNIITRLQQGIDGFGGNVTIYPSACLKVVGGGILFQGRATIKENSFLCAVGGNIVIGDYVSINKNATIVSRNKIVLGEGTSLGPNVCIYDHNHKFDENGHKKNEFKDAPIIIGKNVWIAANCCILKGAQIGDNSIIGAGCVISGDIPPCSLVTSGRDITIVPLVTRKY